VRHPIYSNSREVKCCTQPEQGINIARQYVTGCSITAAPAKSVTHMLFWWCIYVTTSRGQSTGGKYSTRPVSWAPRIVIFSVTVMEVRSEPSEPSGTLECFRWKLELLLMYHGQCSYKEPWTTSWGQILQIDQAIHTRISASKSRQERVVDTKALTIGSIAQLTI